MNLKELKYLILFLILIGFSFNSKAQALYLADFTAYVEGEEIYVTWTTKKGFTCENIEVQLGIDSGELETVYTYLGVCGAELKEERYFYRISNPHFNKNNYIRLNLGLYGYSRIITVTPRKALEGRVLIFPHPANNQSKILVNNPNRKEMTFKVYSAKGELIREVSGIRESEVSIEALYLPIGHFYLQVIQDDASQIVPLIKSQ